MHSPVLGGHIPGKSSTVQYIGVQVIEENTIIGKAAQRDLLRECVEKS